MRFVIDKAQFAGQFPLSQYGKTRRLIGAGVFHDFEFPIQ